MRIENTDNVIDSRDIIERIEELDNQLEGDYVLDGAYSYSDIEEMKEELRVLKSLAEECEQYADDWEHGVALIHESYFEQYMDEMISDCYELPKNLPFWMRIEYDYDALKMDYITVDFNGETYYIRSC